MFQESYWQAFQSINNVVPRADSHALQRLYMRRRADNVRAFRPHSRFGDADRSLTKENRHNLAKYFVRATGRGEQVSGLLVTTTLLGRFQDALTLRTLGKTLSQS